MEGNQIIGKRVRIISTNEMGYIVSVKENLIEVDFGMLIRKYSFPDCFASFLELEDELLQKEMENAGSSTSFGAFKKLFVDAVDKEINYLKIEGGKRYRAIDGVRLDSQIGGYFYAFDTDIELHFPDGTALKIWGYEKVFSAYVVLCEEFTVIFLTSEYLGETVKTIEFSVAQWQLLESLNDRVLSMSVSKSSIAYELACKGKTKIKKIGGIAKGQSNAICRATSEKITMIWGPPGTGKTQTLANIALEYTNRGERVLMLSYSNVSVDGALLRVAGMSDLPKGQVIRYGYPRMKEILESDYLSSYQFVLNQNPDLAEKYRELLEKKKKTKRKSEQRVWINEELNRIRKNLFEKEQELIQNSAFIATTVSKAVMDSAIYGQQFDVVIFDEASMAYIPQIVFAASLAKKAFVCLGDFKQLPAIVQNPENIHLKQDIFEYTGVTSAVQSGRGHEWLVMLDVQYRMHPEISDFASDYMYDSLLRTGDKVLEYRQDIAACEPVSESPISLLDLSGMYSVCIKTNDSSRINLLSALLAVKQAEKYLDTYQVGIITPYSAQSRLITAMLRDLQANDKRYHNIRCATVHQFQGSEKPIIIYDAVDCYRMKYAGKLLTEINDDTANRLFNVALTRAQGKFILMGNINYFKRKSISKNLMFTEAINYMKYNNIYLQGYEIIEQLEDIESKSLLYLSDSKDTWGKFIEDIRGANKMITIDVPGIIGEDDDMLNEFKESLEEAKEKGVVIVVRHEQNIMIPMFLREYEMIYEYITTPVALIDRQIVWFGQPLCEADFISGGTAIPTDCYTSVRFDGYHTASLLQAFYNL